MSSLLPSLFRAVSSLLPSLFRAVSSLLPSPFCSSVVPVPQAVRSLQLTFHLCPGSTPVVPSYNGTSEMGISKGYGDLGDIESVLYSEVSVC